MVSNGATRGLDRCGCGFRNPCMTPADVSGSELPVCLRYALFEASFPQEGRESQIVESAELSQLDDIYSSFPGFTLRYE